MSVRFSALEHTSGTTRPIFTKFLLVLPVAVARSSYSGVAICYVVPVLWTTSFVRVRSRSYGGLSIALQRVTSLRRRSQASAPVASCPIDHDERRDYRRVHRARGAGGGACSALTPCFLFAGRRLVSWTPKWWSWRWACRRSAAVRHCLRPANSSWLQLSARSRLPTTSRSTRLPWRTKSKNSPSGFRRSAVVFCLNWNRS